MARPRRFVDAHVHLWDLGKIAHPWLTPPFSDGGVMGSVEAIATDYLLDDYLADAEGWNVTGMVHVDAGAAPDAAVDETAWLQGIAEERGMPQAIVAFAALDAAGLDDVLALQASFANVRGIRQIANYHADSGKTYTSRNLLDDEAWRRGYAKLARHGLSFDLQIYPGQMKAAAAFVVRHPEIPVILNHAGMPVELGKEGFAEWCEGMAALAEVPHVSAKISGFGIVDHDWTEASIRSHVLTCIDLFGTDRAMFASDFPTDKLFGSFDRHLKAYDAITANFSDDERDALFAANAERIYRLGAAS